MHKNLKYFVTLFVLGTLPFAFAGPGAHGPNGEHLDAPAGGSLSSLARLPDGSVNVPKLAQRRMEIRTQIGIAAEHPATVELNGRVTINPNAGGQVQAPFAGRLEAGPKGFPTLGQTVARGQVLAWLHPVASAIERGNQQAQLADVRANRMLQEQRVKRLEGLADSVARKEIDAARAELSSLTGRESAIAASVQGKEAITASASGVIARADVLSGQIVDGRALLFEIIDPARLMIEASSTDAGLAERIHGASIRDLPTVALSLQGGGRRLHDGAVTISFLARSKEAKLAVGQPVTVVVQQKDKTKGIALPAEAVVRNPANEPVVWIKAGAERFMAQPVEVRPLDAGTVVVIKGLAPDNRVVVSGAALINQIR